MAMIWFVISLILFVGEMVCPVFFMFWFAIGALASAISAIFEISETLQVAIFVFVSILSFLLTKPFVKNILSKNIERTNLDRVIGKTAIVTEEIKKLEPGEVKVDGKRWTATSNKTIKVGSKVEVLAIEGVKLKVKEKEEDE